MIFVTGNENKVREFREILGIDIISKKLEIPEIQDVELGNVIEGKLKFAYSYFKQPVIVEDTGLFFKALNGFPGALIKMLLGRIGREGILKLLEGFEDKTAIARCAVGFTKDGKDLKIFIGEVRGRIVMPKGVSGFGWDPVFQPEGFNKTFAEMMPEEKNKISHRSEALKDFRSFLKSKCF